MGGKVWKEDQKIQYKASSMSPILMKRNFNNYKMSWLGLGFPIVGDEEFKKNTLKNSTHFYISIEQKFPVETIEDYENNLEEIEKNMIYKIKSTIESDLNKKTCEYEFVINTTNQKVINEFEKILKMYFGDCEKMSRGLGEGVDIDFLNEVYYYENGNCYKFLFSTLENQIEQELVKSKVDENMNSDTKLLEYCKPDSTFKTCSEINSLQKSENLQNNEKSQKC